MNKNDRNQNCQYNNNYSQVQYRPNHNDNHNRDNVIRKNENTSYLNQNNSVQQKTDIICFKCGTTGHKSVNCKIQKKLIKEHVTRSAPKISKIPSYTPIKLINVNNNYKISEHDQNIALLQNVVNETHVKNDDFISKDIANNNGYCDLDNFFKEPVITENKHFSNSNIDTNKNKSNNDIQIHSFKATNKQCLLDRKQYYNAININSYDNKSKDFLHSENINSHVDKKFISTCNPASFPPTYSPGLRLEIIGSINKIENSFIIDTGAMASLIKVDNLTFRKTTKRNGFSKINYGKRF